MAAALASMSTSSHSHEQFVNIPSSTLHHKRIELVYKLRESPRVRRRHTKSRTGCALCKQRRIKCDEAVPACGNCSKRGDECVRPGVETCRSSSASPASSSCPPVKRKAPRQRVAPSQPAPSIEVLSLADEYGAQMELMHHFITQTATTLIFSPQLWRGPLLRLSLQLEYLHNAFLMIAATHLSVLTASFEPDQPRYHHLARKYLLKTLHGYQDALSSPISSTPGDALIAVSLILYHYAWSNVDYASGLHTSLLSSSPTGASETLSDLDLANDPLLNLSVGLRYLFWKTGALAASSESCFHAVALESPRARIVQVLRRGQDDVLGHMESYLLSGYQVVDSESITEESDSSALNLFPDDPVTLAAFSESAGRLAPILAVLSSSTDVQEEPVHIGDSNAFCSSQTQTHKPAVRLTDISRYLFSYPIHFCPVFRSLVAKHDRRALFLLLHFFHVVRRLLPVDRCWWSVHRAALLENHIGRILDVRVDVPTPYVGMKPVTAARLGAGRYRLREWLNGECIHGQF